MLRRTSKRVKQVVDKMRLPAVVRLSRSFWYDAHDGTAAEQLQFAVVIRQLPLMTAWAASAHSSCRAVTSKDKMQRGLQECWRSAQRWRTLISATIITSEQPGQRGLQECWGSAQRWLSSISAAIRSTMLGQRVLQQC